MMTESDSGRTSKDLAKVLIENKVISAAQAQLALADQEVTGMTLEEVLLARRWVDEATLEKLAPWARKKPQAPETYSPTAPSATSYEENLKQYKRLMEKIFGTNWD